MKEIVYIINVSKKPLFHATMSLMTGIVTVARTQFNPNLLPIKSVCPFPDFNKRYEQSFDATALQRAEELWRFYSKNGNLSIMWSGGIDSTVALIALLQTCPTNKTIDVYCNANSINENSELYIKLLNFPNIFFKNSSNISENIEMKMITGELGDQIFGSDMLFKIVNSMGFAQLHEDFPTVINKIFNNRCGETLGNFLYERYRPIVEEAPFKIKTAFDFVWWWNFTQKWQCVKFRKQSMLSPNINPIHFFESDNFQMWSVSNHEKKISSDVESYKMPAKEFIYSFDKNEKYKKSKLKYGSPFGNRFHYFVLYDDGSTIQNWKDCNKLIDELTPQFTY